MSGSDDDEVDDFGDSKTRDVGDDEDESGDYFFSMLFLDEICFS